LFGDLIVQISNSIDIYWLVLTTLMTSLFFVPYIVNRMIEHGFFPAIWNPEPDTRPKAQWAERMMRAHSNAVENLVVFAPLVVCVSILGLNSSFTLLCCKLYFFARLFHYILYTLRVPLLRTICFLVGVFSQVSLAYIILTAI
jgi:uncharacterized MAPEG superfamily protein